MTNKRIISIGLALLLVVAAFCFTVFNQDSSKQTATAPLTTRSIDSDEALLIGNKIFQNECGGREALLTSWNSGEDFPSLGIGHFIWYPQGATGPFEESFPELIRFMQDEEVTIPEWIVTATQSGAPWQSRDAFLAAQDSEKMQQLRMFLAATKPEQTRFMIARLNRALPAILKPLSEAEQSRVKARFKQVADSPMGYYALVDYVNFKGEGVKPSERYQGKGWGLLQVLQQMSDEKPATQAFAEAADKVLTRRVELSPTERGETRWLPGWRKRLATYTATIN